MHKNDSDEKLMLGACNGDEKAFNELYKRHKTKLYSYIGLKMKTHHLGGRWESDGTKFESGIGSSVDDIYNDIWINLMKACEKYVESIPFLPYVYKMAANRVIDEYRKMRTRNNLIDDNFGQVLQSNDDDNATVDYNDPAAKTPEAVAETDDMLTVAYHMLSRLPDEQRESFVLYALGHNMREIADLTDVNTETAKSRVRYAVNKLRPDLERLKRE